MSKILHIQRVVMRWEFGAYNRDVSRNEPAPPAVIDPGPPELLTTLAGAVAVLGRKAGRIKFVFHTPMGEDGNSAKDELRARVDQMEAERVFTCINVTDGLNGYFDFSFRFAAQSGEPLTATATRCFIATLKRFIRMENLFTIPIPQVSSETIWKIGEEKVPFGVGIALDNYMGGAFKRIRRVYRNKGEIIAVELYRRLRRMLLSLECSDIVFSHTEGAEVLIGGSIRDRICLSLLIDGYSHQSEKFNNASSLPGEAKKIALTIKKYSLKSCKIFQGECLDFEERKRISCQELEYNPFEVFVRALEKEGISIIE